LIHSTTKRQWIEQPYWSNHPFQPMSRWLLGLKRVKPGDESNIRAMQFRKTGQSNGQHSFSQSRPANMAQNQHAMWVVLPWHRD
jgi:hypothetical protein